MFFNYESQGPPDIPHAREAEFGLDVSWAVGPAKPPVWALFVGLSAAIGPEASDQR